MTCTQQNRRSLTTMHVFAVHRNMFAIAIADVAGKYQRRAESMPRTIVLLNPVASVRLASSRASTLICNRSLPFVTTTIALCSHQR